VFESRRRQASRRRENGAYQTYFPNSLCAGRAVARKLSNRGQIFKKRPPPRPPPPKKRGEFLE